MATGGQSFSLADELTCSICLDYFKSPVTLLCGHNFCRACINGCLASSGARSFSCPQCRATHLDRNLRPNRQLGKVVDMVKVLPSLKQGNLCAKHFERLQLFCEDDMQLICVVCDRSQDHRSHWVLPVEEAATKYKEYLQSSITEMKNDLRDVKSATAEGVQKRVRIEEVFKGETKNIVSSFRQLQQFLEKEMQDLLGELKRREQEYLRKTEQNVSKLQEHSASLNNLIGEIEGVWNQDLKLLKVVQSSISRAEEIKGLQLSASCAEMSRNYQDFGVQHTYVQEKIMKLKETFPDVLETTYQHFLYGASPLNEDIPQQTQISQHKRFEETRCKLLKTGSADMDTSEFACSMDQETTRIIPATPVRRARLDSQR
ncbi:E3 ubiquitin-protein ligase TRIM39-like [Ambystoma mexicanum]|uniref:E3 ubiquitin-protein ligase TRIM39-like n=1 Tax=Ambystoma mexicanum TaxID=8296 RepID=UPI0037E7B02B